MANWLCQIDSKVGITVYNKSNNFFPTADLTLLLIWLTYVKNSIVIFDYKKEYISMSSDKCIFSLIHQNWKGDHFS